METAAILVRVVLELGQEVVTTRLLQTGVPIAMDQQRNPKRVIQMLAVSYKYYLTRSNTRRLICLTMYLCTFHFHF